MLVVISVSYDRFLVLLCHDQQEFLQGLFGMQMLLGQDWVKRVQFYVACHGMFRIFFLLWMHISQYISEQRGLRVLVGNQCSYTR